MAKKLAVFFPGIGYTNDKPLMYYSKKLLRQAGYDTVDVNYTGFDNSLKGNKEKMLKAFETGYNQAKDILKDVDFNSFEEIVFVSKSIGTAVAAKYAIDNDIMLKNIYLTPLEFTFMNNMREGIAFTGTSDPWVATETIKDNCDAYKIPLTIIKDANHSLELEDIGTNLDIIKTVLYKIGQYLCL